MIKLKKIGILMLAGLLSVSGTVLPVSAASRTGSTTDTSTYDPAALVKETATTYRQATAGDTTGICYRILKSPSVRTQTNDGGVTWVSDNNGGKPAEGDITWDYTITLPSYAATNITASPYTAATDWFGLYYPFYDSQGLDEDENEAYREEYHNDIYQYAANVKSATTKVVSRDRTAGTSTVKVTLTYSVPRDGTILEDEIPDSKYSSVKLKNTDIMMRSSSAYMTSDQADEDNYIRNGALDKPRETTETFKAIAKNAWKDKQEDVQKAIDSWLTDFNQGHFEAVPQAFSRLNTSIQKALLEIQNEGGFSALAQKQLDAENRAIDIYNASLSGYEEAYKEYLREDSRTRYTEYINSLNAKWAAEGTGYKITLTEADYEAAYQRALEEFETYTGEHRICKVKADF